MRTTVLGGPGGDLLSRVLRQSTIGAEAFDGRVRDGIGSYRLAEGHQAGEEQWTGQIGRDKLAVSLQAWTRRLEAKLVFSFGSDDDGQTGTARVPA